MVTAPEPVQPPAILRELPSDAGGTRAAAAASGKHARRSARLQQAAAIALLAAMAYLLSSSMREESPTTDETVHLTRGVAFYWGHGASLSYAHPPLGNALAALPVVLREPEHDLTHSESYQLGQVDRVGKELLEDHYSERRRWFFEARSAVSLIALAMAAYCYWLASQLFGRTVGLCSLLFIALNPTLIAHGRLMTTDLPVTAAMTMCVGELVLFLVGRARWHAWTAALMFGAALITKYTALALVPVLGALAGGFAFFGLGRYAGLGRRRALQRVALLGVLFVCSGLTLINAIYRFDRTGLSVAQILEQPEPENMITRGFKGELLERRSVLKFLPGWLRVPVPYTYLYGLTSITVHDRSGHPSSFFGKPIRRGHPAYFPVMLLIKTPLLELCGLFAALIVAWQRRWRVGLGAWALTFYAGALLLLATRAGINIGIRHILPLLPVLGLIAGLGAVRAWQGVGRSRMRTSITGCLIASHVLGLAWCFPDYISDFNALVGGRRGGEQISIVGEEWGQDMFRLGRELKARGVEFLRHNPDTFTSTLELAQFGVTIDRPGCPRRSPGKGWLAVSAREFVRAPECWEWVLDTAPQFVVNNHIWVYDLP
ncbi:MAG TPA: glycosyltransferase family 39 protein [Polyangiales bacterium]|nr:glycosyltransferase family 39 protein [Polyangiales bacterium]